MKVLQQELKLVSEAAPQGTHVKVAKEMGFGAEYLYQIRAGKNMLAVTEENKKTLQKLIDLYRQFNREFLRNLSLVS